MSPATSKNRLHWRELLEFHRPLLLPAAHDALTAKLIEEAGFPAYQIGGFALEASRYGFPDIDLSRLREKSFAVQDIMFACELPVLVDADDGYGDVKNVTHTVRLYESMGVSAIFIEDQKSPKRCGHLSGKQVIEQEVMAEKIEAAVQARRDPTSIFLIARTDAIAPHGLREAIKRGERYLEAGADAIYLEGPTSVEQLREIGQAFRGVYQATNILEGGGQTPWMPPEQLAELGFSMVLYPTTIIFRVAKTIQSALRELKAGHPMNTWEAVNLQEFETLLGLPFWQHVENQHQATQRDHLGMKEWFKHSAQRLFRKSS
jgi:2-methylisocitrate lyase-like PEP mutase family enzyme